MHWFNTEGKIHAFLSDGRRIIHPQTVNESAVSNVCGTHTTTPSYNTELIAAKQKTPCVHEQELAPGVMPLCCGCLCALVRAGLFSRCNVFQSPVPATPVGIFGPCFPLRLAAKKNSALPSRPFCVSPSGAKAIIVDWQAALLTCIFWLLFSSP